MKVPRFAGILLALFLGSFASAQMDGEYTVHITDEDLAVYNVSGDYTFTWLPWPTDASTTLNDSGQIVGTGHISYSGGGASVDMDFEIDGKASTQNGKLRVQYRFKASGQVSYAGRTTKFRLTVSADMTADPGSNTMSGTVTYAVSVQGYSGAGRVTEKITLDLPPTSDGTWDLTFNVTTDDSGTVSGTAVGTLPNGDPIVFDVRGKYSHKTGTTTLILQEGRNKLRMTVTDEGSDLAFNKVRGKVLGQRLKR